MSFSVSARQPDHIRAMADELRVDYRDIKMMYKLIEDFPDKKYQVVITNSDDNVDWQELHMFAEKVKLTCALENLFMSPNCGVDIPFFWLYAVNSYDIVNTLIDLGVSEIRVEAPLTFDLEQLASFNVPIRMIVNVCYDGRMPRRTGVTGSYVRPEDIELYSNWVDTFEFDASSIDKEAVLLKTYLSGKWPGNLNLLLTNLKFDVDNRGIPTEFGEVRANCKQRCMRSHDCHWCETAFNFCRLIDKNASNWDSEKGLLDSTP